MCNLEFKQALEDYRMAQQYFNLATGDRIDEAIFYLNACEKRLMRIIQEQKHRE
jgi:hypothetical protein